MAFISQAGALGTVLAVFLLLQHGACGRRTLDGDDLMLEAIGTGEVADCEFASGGTLRQAVKGVEPVEVERSLGAGQYGETFKVQIGGKAYAMKLRDSGVEKWNYALHQQEASAHDVFRWREMIASGEPQLDRYLVKFEGLCKWNPTSSKPAGVEEWGTPGGGDSSTPRYVNHVALIMELVEGLNPGGCTASHRQGFEAYKLAMRNSVYAWSDMDHSIRGSSGKNVFCLSHDGAVKVFDFGLMEKSRWDTMKMFNEFLSEGEFERATGISSKARADHKFWMHARTDLWPSLWNFNDDDREKEDSVKSNNNMFSQFAQGTFGEAASGKAWTLNDLAAVVSKVESAGLCGPMSKWASYDAELEEALRPFYDIREWAPGVPSWFSLYGGRFQNTIRTPEYRMVKFLRDCATQSEAEKEVLKRRAHVFEALGVCIPAIESDTPGESPSSEEISKFKSGQICSMTSVKDAEGCLPEHEDLLFTDVQGAWAQREKRCKQLEAAVAAHEQAEAQCSALERRLRYPAPDTDCGALFQEGLNPVCPDGSAERLTSALQKCKHDQEAQQRLCSAGIEQDDGLSSGADCAKELGSVSGCKNSYRSYGAIDELFESQVEQCRQRHPRYNVRVPVAWYLTAYPLGISNLVLSEDPCGSQWGEGSPCAAAVVAYLHEKTGLSGDGTSEAVRLAAAQFQPMTGGYEAGYDAGALTSWAVEVAKLLEAEVSQKIAGLIAGALEKNKDGSEGACVFQDSDPQKKYWEWGMQSKCDEALKRALEAELLIASADLETLLGKLKGWYHVSNRFLYTEDETYTHWTVHQWAAAIYNSLQSGTA